MRNPRFIITRPFEYKGETYRTYMRIVTSFKVKACEFREERRDATSFLSSHDALAAVAELVPARNQHRCEVLEINCATPSNFVWKRMHWQK